MVVCACRNSGSFECPLTLVSFLNGWVLVEIVEVHFALHWLSFIGEGRFVFLCTLDCFSGGSFLQSKSLFIKKNVNFGMKKQDAQLILILYSRLASSFSNLLFFFFEALFCGVLSPCSAYD